MRVAVAQTPMGWTAEENLRAVLDQLALARAAGAPVALFPECAVTGYHRRVPELVARGAGEAGIALVREACSKLGIAAVVGAPLAAEEGVRNAMVAIGPDGAVAGVTHKAGITASERRYFAPGEGRPVFELCGVRCAVVLCREIRDVASLGPLLDGAEIVFWPGAITWDDDLAHPDHVDEAMARAFALATGAYLVQCNWPVSLNRPDASRLGGSLVLSPEGDVLLRAPLDEVGVWTVELPISGRPTPLLSGPLRA